jgi:hypothetical protein
MIFPVITDTHLDRKCPALRTDPDFSSTILGKLEFIFNYARREGCKYIGHCGDLGDNPKWSPSVLRDFIKLRQEFSDIELICTVGQHDVEEKEVSSYSRYTMGVLEQAGLITVLVSGNYIVRDELAIYGFGFGEPETTELLAGRTFPFPETKSLIKVALIHASVGGEDGPGWTAVSRHNINGFDLACFGDIHTGFKPYRFDSGCYGASGGAIIRQRKDEVDMIPKFINVVIEDGSIAYLDYVVIPCLPAEDVFDMRLISKQRKDRAVAFKAAHLRSKDIVNETPDLVLRRIGKKTGFSTTTIELAIANLGDTE